MAKELTSIRCGKCLRIITQTLLESIVWSEPCECWLEEPPAYVDKVWLGGNCGMLVTLRGGPNDTISEILNQDTNVAPDNVLSKDENIL